MDFINSDIGQIRILVHLDFSPIRTIVVRSPGIRTSSIRTAVGEPILTIPLGFVQFQLEFPLELSLMIDSVDLYYALIVYSALLSIDSIIV